MIIYKEMCVNRCVFCNLKFCGKIMYHYDLMHTAHISILFVCKHKMEGITSTVRAVAGEKSLECIQPERSILFYFCCISYFCYVYFISDIMYLCMFCFVRSLRIHEGMCEKVGEYVSDERVM